MSSKDRIETTLTKQIVYGNISTKLPIKLANGHTHRWTIYVKPYNVEKLNNFIRKVQFKLHSDYENSVRVVEQANSNGSFEVDETGWVVEQANSNGSFEVDETGWGEFPVQIKISFIDPSERQAICSHYLALHQPEFIENDGSIVVVKEVLDQLVFVNPTKKMFDVLNDKSLVKPHDPSKWRFNYPEIIEAQEKMLEELAEQSEREVEELREAIREMAKRCEEYHEKLRETPGYVENNDEE
uniref:Protein AF-9 homolog n=1 Tax=Panagrolaimus sp. PS1159 TaxID=55785 RepID=A0AC35FHK8_9BILA